MCARIKRVPLDKSSPADLKALRAFSLVFISIRICNVVSIHMSIVYVMTLSIHYKVDNKKVFYKKQKKSIMRKNILLYTACMKISFFEEYPTEETMKTLDLIHWESTVFLASPSFIEYRRLCTLYTSKYPHVTFGWWPTVSGSYWISALSDPQSLEKTFTEIISSSHEHKVPVLIDLELPRSRLTCIKNILHIRNNKKRIDSFFKEASLHNIALFTAEYPSPNNLMYALWKLLGLSPRLSLPHTKIPMCYSSMVRTSFGEKILKRIQVFEHRFANKHTDRVCFGLGTIATGVTGNEPLLSIRRFENDLTWARESGMREVFIFRLGGLNTEYLSMIEKFLE